MNKNNLKEDFIKLLRSTNREGIEAVIEWLTSEDSDFFIAPASTMFHGDYEGGLLEHSINVAHIAIKIKEMLENVVNKQQNSASDLYLKTILSEQADKLSSLKRESILIVGLLHDVCKTNIYKKDFRNKKIDGNWVSVECYTADYSDFPVGHGEKSVIKLLQLGLKLTEEEILAIRWHMSAWDLPFQSAEAKSNINAAKEKSVLLSILQSADQLATAVLETKQ